MFGGFIWYMVTSMVRMIKISKLMTTDLLTPFLTLLFSVVNGLMIAYWRKK
jgi:hypothetical protein